MGIEEGSPKKNDWESVAQNFEERIKVLDIKIKHLIQNNSFAAAYDAIHLLEQTNIKNEFNIGTESSVYGGITRHPDVAFLISLQKLKSVLEKAVETKGESVK